MALIREGSVYSLFREVGDNVRFLDRGTISAGDGERYEHIPGLAPLRMRQTTLAMAYLQRQGIPTTFVRAVGEEEMLCREVEMIPLEVVVRAAALGSYLKRHPNDRERWFLGGGMVVELFHKQTFMAERQQLVDGNELRRLGPAEVKRLKEAGEAFPDPYIFVHAGGMWSLHDAQAPLDPTAALGVIPPVVSQSAFQSLRDLSAWSFGLLRQAFAGVDGAKLGIAPDCKSIWLADIKFEFGWLPDGTLVLADVVTLDSMRLMVNGELGVNKRHMSKQTFRDGADAAEVLRVYQHGTHAFELAFAA